MFGLVVLLQYKLWFTNDGVMQFQNLKIAVHNQAEENTVFAKQNQQILAEVKDLKYGHKAIEDHARKDLGMIKQDEVFYQIVEQ